MGDRLEAVQVFASASALELGPFRFREQLRSSCPTLHRWSGRLYLGLGVLVGGLAGLLVAFNPSGVSMEVAYPVVAWLCGIPNLIVAELLFNATRLHGVQATPAGGRR